MKWSDIICEAYASDQQMQTELRCLYQQIITAVQSSHVRLRRDRSGQLCFINLDDIDPRYDVQLGMFPQNNPVMVKGLDGKAWLVVLTADQVVRTPEEFVAQLQAVRPQFFHEMTHVLDVYRYKNRQKPFDSGSQDAIDWAQHDNMPSEMNANFHQTIREFENTWELSMGNEANQSVITGIQQDFNFFLSIIRQQRFFGRLLAHLTDANKRRLIKRLYQYWEGRFGRNISLTV